MKPTSSEVKVLFEKSTRDLCDHCTIRRERFVYDDLMLCYDCLAEREDRDNVTPMENYLYNDEHSEYL